MSEIHIELPVLVTRVDRREDVIVVQMYLVDAKVLFLCRKRTLESWNFKIDGESKILEIQSKVDGLRKKINMIDSQS